MLDRKKNRGFTLIEIAVVVMIIGLIAGSILGPLSERVRLQNISETEEQLAEIKKAILGFVAAHGYLPCPSEPGSNGAEERGAGVGVPNALNTPCLSNDGFVPFRTLGLSGSVKSISAGGSSGNVLISAGNFPIHYAVSTYNDAASNNNTNPNNVADFTFENLDGVQPSALTPSDMGVNANRIIARRHITVCSTNPCNDVTLSQNIAINVPAILYVVGNRRTLAEASALEDENIDSEGGTNRYFISAPHDKNTFDDILTWISSNEVYSVLLEMGRIP